MKNRRARRVSHLFTLIEMVAVVVILGILATVLIAFVPGHLANARISAAKAHIRQIEDAVQMFYMDSGKYPEKLKDLVNKPPGAKNWKKDGYLKVLPRDPWGQDYRYKTPGPDGKAYLIASYGADGQEGGKDDNADITCWNIYDEEGKE